ncbi:hypothetical protein E8E11_006654 [Didymella keratinophila]|nr:hypothetical protein E8E11_006654 [Didymella keratinophila]
MAIFGLHSSTATIPKSRLISAPIHARHVGGVSITGGTGGNTALDTYFAPTSLEPDELPSHTYAANGVIEVPRRSNTFTNAVRRPSLSIKRSFSRLRSASISQGHQRSQSDNRPAMMSTRSDPVLIPSIQRKPSATPARPKMSFEYDLYDSANESKHAEIDVAPPPPPKDLPRLDANDSMNSKSIRPVTTLNKSAEREETPPPLPVRPKRSDSGTAIASDDVVGPLRPMGFNEIAAMRSYKDRMAWYEKTRDYWANAEHGLAEWTGRTGGPRTVQLSREAC